MSTPKAIRGRFEAMCTGGALLLSGGLGSELRRRGVPTPLPLWAAAALRDAPGEVRRVHADYVRAGARLLTANTFRTDRGTLARAGLGGEARALTRAAVEIARRAAAAAPPGAPVLVAGSVGPLADCYRPADVPADDVLRAEHGLRVGDLVTAGVDLVLVETMNTVREAVAALGAAHAGDLPAAVAFVCGPGGALLSGESIQAAVAAVEPLDPLAILVNCCAPAHATEALDHLRLATRRPVGVYANGRGRPDGAQGWTFRGGTSDRAYVRHARRWLAMGARLIGGCCGTTPRTIRKLRDLLHRRRGPGTRRS